MSVRIKRWNRSICLFLVVIIVVGALQGCSCTNLSEEKQEELNADSEHAISDAKNYLQQKYSINFELNFFEPYVYFRTSDANWFVKTHYDRIWNGEFTVEGEIYQIKGNLYTNEFSDSYQFRKIRAAYAELAKEYL